MKALVSFLRVTRLWIVTVPILISFLGAASNQAVLIANHDRFPVMVNHRAVAAHSDSDTDESGPDADGMLDDVHCLMTAQTRLNWLADIFDFKTAIMSPGDLLLDLGSYLMDYAPFAWVLLMIGDALRRRSAA